MRRTILIGLLAAVCTIGSAANAAVAAKPPASFTEADCTADNEKVREVFRDLTTCALDAGKPLFVSDMTPEAAAAAAMAHCPGQLARAAAMAKTCRSPSFEPEERRILASVVENRRARSDYLWDQGGAWQKGACRIDDPQFKAMNDAHFDCMLKSAKHGQSQAKAMSAIGSAALAQCIAKEAPIRERISSCQDGDASPIMSAFEAFEQELMLFYLLDEAHRTGIPANAPAELTDPSLLQEVGLYEACVIFQTKAGALPGGDADAILLKARNICASTRMDLAAYGKAHLSPVEQSAILQTADEEATSFAAAELEAVGLKLTAAPAGGD